jgi:isopentenyl-diphosphate delta-isomerase
VEQVILVDPEGRQIGTCEKLAAHQRGGRLHLAFSIFVYNGQEELLIQKRAATKYHFASLWSNTCCGHPRPGEPLIDAAGRRLQEEFGFSTTLRPLCTFIYHAQDEKSHLTEQELCHLLIGPYEGPLAPEPAEIDQWRWQSPAELRSAIEKAPDQYTPWLRIIMGKWKTPLGS